MADQTCRVIVKGRFADLDSARRATLLQSMKDHDFLRSGFTDDGTLTYDEHGCHPRPSAPPQVGRCLVRPVVGPQRSSRCGPTTTCEDQLAGSRMNTGISRSVFFW
jgi:hypothetical protein